ncbi:unnamed protein product [Mytilus coruscus]|uniref:Uncharacterized protein n=1 Tax=Mytilus coruscus TaxID=42192 RepID=A0A6J8A587_MYTCO|nr:unnamed protein product [Mytilus coruscus]
MVVQNPPIIHEGPVRRSYINRDVYQEFTKRGSIIDYCVWPALEVENGGPLVDCLCNETLSCVTQDGKHGYCMGGQCLTEVQSRSRSDLEFRIIARYPEINIKEIKNKDLYIRGSGLGLNWTSGKKMTKISTDTWKMHFTFTSSDDGFRCQDCSNDITINKKLEYRILIADKTNMIGGNFVVHLPVAMPSSYFHEKPLFKVYPWFYSTAGHTSNFTIHSQEIGKERKIYLLMIEKCGKRDNIKGFGDRLLDFFIDKVRPKAQKNANDRILIDQPNTGVMGYSLGGLMSCYAAWTRSSIFGLAACQSPSLWWPLNNATLNSSDFDFINNTLRDQSFQQTRFPQKIILDAGSEETVSPYRLTQSTVEAAKMISNISGFTMNRNVWVNIYPGASHTVLEWFSRFWTVCQTLLPSDGAPQIPQSHTGSRGVCC